MQTKQKIQLSTLLCLWLLAACGGSGGDDDSDGPPVPVTTTNYQVVFSPMLVIGGTAAPDTVTATANLSSAAGEEITARGSVTVTGASATAVTINAGYAGEAGPVALALSDGGGGTWNVPSNTELSRDELLRLEASGFYVSIQTASGELRGQILPPGYIVAMVDLDAGSVVPETTSAGAARAGFAINPSTGFYAARVTVDGISDAFSAGIRSGIAGARGDVIAGLEQSLSASNVWGTRDINNVDASDRFSQPQLELLATGSLFFSVETAANPNGELRGQILDDSVVIFEDTLTTGEVVTTGPPVVSNAQGKATVTWIESISRLGVAVNTDITNALSVSVQQGAPGENGSVLFSLTPDVMLPGNWVLPMTELSAEQADALLNGQMYVSVVTAQYIDGELRGQLSLQPEEPTSIETIGENGGALSVTGDDGTVFTLTVGPDALTDETVTMSMSVTDPLFALPAGLTPIAAVQLEPAGTSFAEFPMLEIDASLPAGAKVAFIASNDGSTIEFRPLAGDDFISASLATDGAEFDVPHFSVAGVASLDDLCEFDPGESGLGVEATAVNAITAHLAYVACLQITGVEADVDVALIGRLLQPWFDDLVDRTQQSSAQNIRTFGELLAETLRYGSYAQMGGQEFSATNNAATSSLFDVFETRIRTLDTACLGGEPLRTDDFVRWLGKVYRVYGTGRPDSFSAPVVSCLVTGDVTPEGPNAVIVDSPPIVAEPVVTGADGRDLSSFSVLALGWETTSGGSQTDGFAIELDTSTVGVREARLTSAFFEFAEPAIARGLVVYDHRGLRQLSADGTAIGCEDPEDDGSRVFFLEVTIGTQQVTANEDGSASVVFSGSGGGSGITINSINISVDYNQNSETTIGGSASGALSFTEFFIDEETGDPMTNIGSIVLAATSASSTSFSFDSAIGSDQAGCLLAGRVSLSRPL